VIVIGQMDGKTSRRRGITTLALLRDGLRRRRTKP